MILHAQCAMDQHGEDLFGEIGIRADGLSLSANTLQHYSLTGRVAYDSTQRGLRGTDLSRLGQASTDRDDDFRIDDIEFCAQS